MFRRYRKQRLDRKLVRAVITGDASGVAALLKAGASPNADSAEKIGTGASPLTYAAAEGHAKIVKLLLSHGASTDLPNAEGHTAMDEAILNGHFDIAQHFLDGGVSLRHFTTPDIPTLNNLLLGAAANGNVRDMEMLLTCGADLEARGGNNVHWNGTPLSVAAYKGFLGAVKFLIDRGANINAADKDGDTILNAAIIHDEVDVVEELLKRGADPAIRSLRNENAVDVGRKKTSLRLYQLLGIESEMAPLATPDDEVTFRRPFNGRVLEETFNFAAKERISVILKTPDGPVEAMTRDSFSAIGDRSALRRAYDAYVQKGGKASESEIFPDGLSKAKVAPPKLGD